MTIRAPFIVTHDLINYLRGKNLCPFLLTSVWSWQILKFHRSQAYFERRKLRWSVGYVRTDFQQTEIIE